MGKDTGLNHPEKPPYSGAAFKYVDGKPFRLRDTSEPFTPEIVDFLAQRVIENDEIWHDYISSTLMSDRPYGWYSPVDKLVEAYYPGASDGTLPLHKRLMVLMREFAFGDPTSFKAGDVRAHFELIDEQEPLVRELVKKSQGG